MFALAYIGSVRQRQGALLIGLLCLILTFVVYATRYVWLAERVAQDELFLHSLRLKLSTLSGKLGNCTAIVDAVLDEQPRAQSNSVAVDRSFVDACVAQSNELTLTIQSLQDKLTMQTTLVHELRDQIASLNNQQQQQQRLPDSSEALIRSLQHEITALRSANVSLSSPSCTATELADVKFLKELVAQRDFLSMQLSTNAERVALHAYADCGHASLCDARVRSETHQLVQQCNAQLAVVTSQLPELRRDSQAALETGYVSYINADLDRLITENTLNGTLYMTALKYQPEWVLNWWHWLRASGVRTALVFACDESLLAFCEQHDIPVFGAWPLLEPYALCDRVDRGSGVKLRALIEVLKRGIDVVYSDADVVWRRPFVPPRKPHGAPPYDIAFQSYSPLPDADMEALVQYGTNFGLFHARATKRAIGWLQRLLPRAASYFSFVTAPHWRTRQGLDQFRVYACNDQNALHAFLAEGDAVCQYTSDRNVTERASGAARDCAVIAMLSPTRYPTAMPFIYAQRDWHDANDSALVALHLTTYPGADKTHGARELRLWAADEIELGGVDAQRFVMLDQAQLGGGDSLETAVVQPLALLIAFAHASNRIAILPQLPCKWHPLFDAAAGGRRAKPTRARPFVLGRSLCTADLYFELSAMVANGVQFRAHSFLAQVSERPQPPPSQASVSLEGTAVNHVSVKAALDSVGDPVIAVWRDFTRFARTGVLDSALQLNTFYNWSTEIIP